MVYASRFEGWILSASRTSPGPNTYAVCISSSLERYSRAKVVCKRKEIYITLNEVLWYMFLHMNMIVIYKKDFTIRS